jgi:type IV secretory pathway VirB6-like protein
MYRRETIFLTVQTLFYGIIVLLVQSDSDICLPLKLVASIILLVIIDFVGLGVLKMIEIDRKCRNTFNKEIVEILKRTNLFEESATNWKNDEWDATSDDHPINLWHTPYNVKDGRASRIIEKIIKVLIVLNFLLVILLAILLKSLSVILLLILLVIVLVILVVD